jgi:DNA repair exonuclease SbcCD ATPase subunit
MTMEKFDPYLSLLVKTHLGKSVGRIDKELDEDGKEVQQLVDGGDYKGALVKLLSYYSWLRVERSEHERLHDDYKSLEEDYDSLENEKDQTEDEKGEAIDIANKAIDLLNEYLELDVKNVVGHSKEYDKAVKLRQKIEEFMDEEGERLTDL